LSTASIYPCCLHHLNCDHTFPRYGDRDSLSNSGDACAGCSKLVLKLLRRADSLLAYMISSCSCFSIVVTYSLHLQSLLIDLFTQRFEYLLSHNARNDHGLSTCIVRRLIEVQPHLDAINKTTLELPECLYPDHNNLHRANGNFEASPAHAILGVVKIMPRLRSTSGSDLSCCTRLFRLW
jgi:hypothetical protein